MSSSSSSSSSSKSKRPGGVMGPRPQPLSLSALAASSPMNRPSKKPRGGDAVVVAGSVQPVKIVYERTPRVVHAGPHEFMAVVQRLTGKQQQPTLAASPVPGAAGARDETTTTTADPLVLTLGHQQRRPAPPPRDGDHSAPPPSSPTPAAVSLLSSISFPFSPTTMQAIQELSALF